MKHVLNEILDFQFGTMKVVFHHIQPSVHLHDGTVLSSIKNPRPNSIVLLRKRHQLIPVQIVDGEYEVNGRITNEWKWISIFEDGSCGCIEEGYGDFFEPHKQYTISNKTQVLALAYA